MYRIDATTTLSLDHEYTSFEGFRDYIGYIPTFHMNGSFPPQLIGVYGKST
jgi:hypothetical protein